MGPAAASALARGVALGLILAGLPASCTTADAGAPHGIVLIVSDDHGYGSTNAYGAPNAIIHTEHMDRIGAEGVRFTRASTTSSVCSPSRYAIMTGRYVWRSAHTDGSMLGAYDRLSIELDRPTLASMMRRAGYATAAIGKWHLGLGVDDMARKLATRWSDSLSPGPIELGFDYFFGVPANLNQQPAALYVENHTRVGTPVLAQPKAQRSRGRALKFRSWLNKQVARIRRNNVYAANERVRSWSEASVVDTEKASARAQQGTTTAPPSSCPEHAPMPLPRRHRAGVGAEPVEWATDTFVTRALEWLETVAHRPFFLYFATTALHSPITPCSPCGHCGSAAGKYADFVHELDWAVGRLLAFLERRQGPSEQAALARDTLVVFLSDNGAPKTGRELRAANDMGLSSNGHLRGHKGTYWEGGVRVPMMMRWPGHIKPGHVSDELVSAIDVYATLAAITRTALVAGEAPDSVNLLPLLLRKAAQSPRRSLVIQSECSAFAVVSRDWKLVEGVNAESPTVKSWLNTTSPHFRARCLNGEGLPPNRPTRGQRAHPEGKFPPAQHTVYALAGTPAEATNMLLEPGNNSAATEVRTSLLRELNDVRGEVLSITMGRGG